MKTGFAAFTLCILLLIGVTTDAADAKKRPSLPNASVKTLDGRTWSIAGQGDRVCVLHFWSLNCRPCLEVVPRLRRLNGSWKERNDVVLVSLPTDEDLIQVRRHVKRHRMSWTHLVTEKGSALSVLAGPLGVQRMPTPYFWIVDGNGEIRGATGNPEEARKVAERLASGLESVVGKP